MLLKKMTNAIISLIYGNEFEASCRAKLSFKYSTFFDFATLPLPSRYQRHHCVTDRYRILSNVTHGSSTVHTVTSMLPIITSPLPKHFVYLSFLAFIQRVFLRKSTTPKKFFWFQGQEEFFSHNIISYIKLR